VETSIIIAMIGRIALFLSALLTLAVSASADEFTFSYTFASGNALFGTVEGDLAADQNTVTNLRNLSATYSPNPVLLTYLAIPFTVSLKLNGGIRINFYGFQTDILGAVHKDFGFALSDPGFMCLNCATVGNFSVQPGGIVYPFGPDQFEAEVFNSVRWRASPVPEPNAVGLLSLAILATGYRMSRVASPRQIQERSPESRRTEIRPDLGDVCELD
jgi:hypothetical protein